MQVESKWWTRSEVKAAFIVLAGTAWASGLVYLVVRVNLPSPGRLAVVDGLHAYVGIASLVFCIAVLAATRSASGSKTTRPARWLWWVLSGLYFALYATGALLLVPWSGRLRTILVDVHLLAAVWAVVPTSWYLVQGRLQMLRSRPARLLAIGLALVFLPAAFVAAAPRAITPLARSGTGEAWQPQALAQTFVDRMATSPDGQTVLAGGEGLYVSHPGGRWQQIAFPRELVLGLALPAGPVAAYVGTSEGLYAAAQVTGPYRRLPFAAREVHAIAVDPVDPSVVWASSRSGFWRSVDAGRDWVPESAGIQRPSGAWAIAFFGGSIFASDAIAVYRWVGARWLQSSDQGLVASLDPSADGRRLFASSMGQGIRVFDGQIWTESDAGLAGHGGRGAIHVAAVTGVSTARAYAATMLDGVAVSADGGRTWSPLSAGLPAGSVWRVLQPGPELLAATDRGVFAYPLREAPAPGLAWWTLLLGGSLAGASAALWLLTARRRRSP